MGRVAGRRAQGEEKPRQVFWPFNPLGLILIHSLTLETPAWSLRLRGETNTPLGGCIPAVSARQFRGRRRRPSPRADTSWWGDKPATTAASIRRAPVGCQVPGPAPWCSPALTVTSGRGTDIPTQRSGDTEEPESSLSFQRSLVIRAGFCLVWGLANRAVLARPGARNILES